MTNPFREDDWRFLFYGVPLLASGTLIGYFLIPHPTRFDEVHLGPGYYQYINPLLACTDFSPAAPADVDTAQDEVKSYVASAKQNGSTDEVAVYFRDLNNGSSWGIGSDETFSPGSLLKVPLLMSVYMVSESNPALLVASYEYKGDDNALPQEIAAPQPLVKGKRYTMQDLMQHTIVDSDNAAANLLYAALGSAAVDRTYQDLDLDPPVVGQDYSLTVKQYATFFLYLYNSSYLTYQDSEKLLELMTHASFTDGLVAGVPQGVPVAHKFGEREVGTSVQLHDCGIVYAKDQPYILCVMTRGADLKALSGVIGRISNIVYTEITKN